jgi:hypothetical protein
MHPDHTSGAGRRTPAVRARRAMVRPGLRLLCVGLCVLAAAVLSWSAAPDVAGARVTLGDWHHVWNVVGYVRASPPAGPVAYYIGDSTARESVVSEAAWTRQLQAMGAHDARGFVLASHGQTFGMDLRIVRDLPRGPGVALIGVSLSRFIGPPVPGSAARPATFPPDVSPSVSPWVQHEYDQRAEMTPAQKHGRVTHWMRARVPRFLRYRAANLAALGSVLASCRQRGLQPVIVDLPLNLAAVRRGLDRPLRSYRSGVRGVARRYHVQYVSFVRALHLRSNAFFDICHLVHRGAVPWQKRLARVAAPRLARLSRPGSFGAG